MEFIEMFGTGGCTISGIKNECVENLSSIDENTIFYVDEFKI